MIKIKFFISINFIKIINKKTINITFLVKSMHTTDQNNKIDVGLKIHIFSFSFNKNLIKEIDDIRMSITTKPDKRKQYFYFNGKQFLNNDLVCTLNITNEANEIYIVIRKKNFIEGHPIIGSTIINSNNLPKIPQSINQLSIDKKETDIITLKILNSFEPHNNDFYSNRNIIGEMKVQISVIPPKPNTNHFNSKDNNIKVLFKDLITESDEIIEPKYNSYIEYILF